MELSKCRVCVDGHSKVRIVFFLRKPPHGMIKASVIFIVESPRAFATVKFKEVMRSTFESGVNMERIS